MSEQEFNWEAPPEPYRPSKWGPYIEAVKKNPGRWLKVGVWKTGSSPPYNAKKWIEANIKDPHLETKVVRFSENETGLWLRWRTNDQLRAANGNGNGGE